MTDKSLEDQVNEAFCLTLCAANSNESCLGCVIRDVIEGMPGVTEKQLLAASRALVGFGRLSEEEMYQMVGKCMGADFSKCISGEQACKEVPCCYWGMCKGKVEAMKRLQSKLLGDDNE